jgi:hypothetical protein
MTAELAETDARIHTKLQDRMIILSDASVAAIITQSVSPIDHDLHSRALHSKAINSMILARCIANVSIGQNTPTSGYFVVMGAVLVIVLSGTLCRWATGNPFAADFLGALCRGMAIAGSILPTYSVCSFA